MATNGSKAEVDGAHDGAQGPSKETRKIIEKVTKLVTLAQSAGEEEARTAAMQAVKLMHEHKLTPIPQEDLERAMKFVEGAKELANKNSSQKKKDMAIGAAIGFFLAGGKVPKFF